jgi:hypothetical protein
MKQKSVKAASATMDDLSIGLKKNDEQQSF